MKLKSTLSLVALLAVLALAACDDATDDTAPAAPDAAATGVPAPAAVQAENPTPAPAPVGLGENTDVPALPAAMTAQPATQPSWWEGKWKGPEGTYLILTDKRADNFEVVIRDLDGERTFQGRRMGDVIRFERDGAAESIRPATGADTGMKYLQDMQDCIMVKPGEGYCKD